MGGGIGGLLSMRQNGEDYFYLYDGKGNVTTIVDSSQSVVATYQYNAFGRLMHTTGTLDQPYQFSTKRYDTGTGLNYYGYRFYSPVIERWLNRDPLGEAGGINLYGFVGGDPVNGVDPWGFAPTECNKNCWLNCMKNYPGMGTAISLATLGTLGNMKLPGIEWKGRGSPFTSLSRRLGARGTLRGGATAVRGSIGRVKYLGRSGTIAAATAAFGAGYLVGASAMCAIECSN
jgi:RHS repeat-associated protein